VARTFRACFVNRLQHPKAWIKAAGYWKRRVANTYLKIEN